MAPFASDIRRWATVADFSAHLARHDPLIAPWAKGVTVHHTVSPTAAQWRGVQTLRGTRDYYITSVPNANGTKGGWTAGPHLFICGDAANPEDRGLYQLTPINIPGIHAGKRCNNDNFAIEVVGRYDRARWSPVTSELVYGAILALLDWRDITDANRIEGHRECLSNKSCPGTAIDMSVVRSEVARRLSLGAANDLAFVSEQRISAAHFVRVLDLAQSPAALYAAELAEIPPIYGIDRAVALAFFEHESSFGKAGVCKEFDTKNWGNVRRPFGPASAIGSTPHPFAIYGNWASGLHDWCRRILGRYVAEGLVTVRKALPIYAPSTDGNRPQKYADAVVAAVARWQREERS